MGAPAWLRVDMRRTCRRPELASRRIAGPRPRGPAAGSGGPHEHPRIPPTPIEPRSRKVTPVPTQAFRADRVASRTNIGRLQGQVVRDDRITPRANATIRFVGEKDEEVV